MRRNAPRRSLSARLLWLTVGVVMVVQVLVFLPALAHERTMWLLRLVRDAHIAALAVETAPDGMVDAQTKADLLHLSGAEMIRLEQPAGYVLALKPADAQMPADVIDLRQEDFLVGMRRAVTALVLGGDRLLGLVATSPVRRGIVVEVTFREHALVHTLRQFAWSVAGVSLLIAGITGVLLYIALLRLLVGPMRRITDSIAAFRLDPLDEETLDEKSAAVAADGADDEIAAAGRELTAMQKELRAALWRNARLAALGTAMAKMSHDLRGILSPAMLSADRLTMSADPATRRVGEIVVQSVQRATQMVQGTLAYVREGRAPLTRSRFPLRVVVQEAAESLGEPGRVLRNRVPATLMAAADRTLLLRVFINLLRNAAQAGAHAVSVTAEAEAAAIVVSLADDGPGLPEAVRATLFRPFAGSQSGGSGLGLAIARDLMRAHGGEVELAETGPTGTAFRLTLPQDQWSGEPAEGRADADAAR